MFENVLVGVDGRTSGRDAIALAAGLLGPGGRLTLAHVNGGELRPTHAVAPGLVREERAASERLLESERSAADVDAELVSVVAMGVGAGLHQRAEDLGADLLVVGSCSHGTFGRAMLGDDTRAALNGAPCAVAIAARGYDERGAPLAKLGVAYNGSPEGRAALDAARELAAASHATIGALEVVSIPSIAYSGIVPESIGEGIDLVLGEATTRMSAIPDVDGKAVYGLAGEELAAFSAGVDLLVVGSRGYGPVRRLVLGSTSNYLERHARCSLLVLPRAAGERAAAGEPAEDARALTV
jgi:nucleotide-binding universal stress UspA family protein